MTEKIQKKVYLTKEALARVEKYRAAQRPIPNLSMALVQLIEVGLKKKPKEK